MKKRKAANLVSVFLTVLAALYCASASSSAAEIELSLKSGQSLKGNVISIDARGIAISQGGSIKNIEPGQLSDNSKSAFDGWLSGNSKAPNIKADVELSLKTETGTLAYDTNQLTAEKGALVRVTLINEDSLPHNIVFSKSPDANSGQAIAAAALDLGGEGMAKQWIPEAGNILAASSMADPKKNVVVYFTAPKVDGEFPYVCTFPGHSLVMKGILKIGESQPKQLQGDFNLTNLTFDVFKGSFDKLPDFSALKPNRSGKIKSNKINLRSTKEKEAFAAVFKGELELPQDGKYSIGLSSDDGSRLLIDGKVIIDNDGVHGMKTKSASPSLKSGSHKLVVQYFEKSGGEEIEISMKSPSGKLLALTPGGNQRRKGNNNVGIPLYPLAGEAMIYRNFIANVGTARGIGVGFSEGIHYAYDAQNGRVAMIWKGGFIDAKRHWTGRGQGYQPPSESFIEIDTLGAIIADLEAVGQDWPAADYVANGKSADYSQSGKPSNFRFLGYTLNNKRHPIFSWTWNGLRVTDYTRPNKAGGMRRTLTFKGQPNKLDGKPFLRLGSGDSDKLEIKIPRSVDKVISDDGIRIPIKLKNGEYKVSINYNFK